MALDKGQVLEAQFAENADCISGAAAFLAVNDDVSFSVWRDLGDPTLELFVGNIEGTGDAPLLELFGGPNIEQDRTVVSGFDLSHLLGGKYWFFDVCG